MDITNIQNTNWQESAATAGSDHLGEILKVELELGRLLFIAGAPGQRILDSISFLNEKLEGGKLKVFSVLRHWLSRSNRGRNGE